MHQAEAQRSSAAPDRQYVDIPTSTIVSIGLGFLAFALTVLLFLLSLRVTRLKRIARRTGRPFALVWESEGGLWGFLTSLGGAESEIVGAGGRAWGMRVIRDREGPDEKNKPMLWDAEWYTSGLDDEQTREETKEDRAVEVMELEDLKPICVSSSTPPSNSKAKTPPSLPTIGICVLIQLPVERVYDPTSGELPALILGTTSLEPVLATRKGTTAHTTRTDMGTEAGHTVRRGLHTPRRTETAVEDREDQSAGPAQEKELDKVDLDLQHLAHKKAEGYKDGIEIEQIEYADLDVDESSGHNERGEGYSTSTPMDGQRNGHSGTAGHVGAGDQTWDLERGRRAEWKWDKGNWRIEGLTL